MSEFGKNGTLCPFINDERGWALMAVKVQTPEETLREFFGNALALEKPIKRVLGPRCDLMYDAIRKRAGSIRFSDDQSDAAFSIDPVTNEFIFFNGGFYALRAAFAEMMGTGIDPIHGVCEVDWRYCLRPA